MSQHGEGEDSLMTENRLNGMHCSARSLSKDDIPLSKYSSTSSIAMLTKNIYSSDSEEDEAWQSILEEDNRLACLDESHSLFSSAKAVTRRKQKGDRDKAKAKFSIRFQTHKKELYSRSVVKTENEESSMSEEERSVFQMHKKELYARSVVKTENEESSMSEEELSVNKIQHGMSAHSVDKGHIQHGISAHSMATLLEELQHENREVQEAGDMSAEEVRARYSMSNLLEDLQKDSPLQRHSKELMRKNTTRVRKAQIAERTTSQLGKRSLNDEDGHELLGSRTSSENEDNDKNHLILATMTRGQTMADIFQEVFSFSTVDAEEVHLARRAGTGYYGRLQQIMQRDKDTQMEFFKQLESGEYLPGSCLFKLTLRARCMKHNCMLKCIVDSSLCAFTPSDTSKGINLKILSRLLDAKLTVCHCLLGDKTTGSINGNSAESDGEIGEGTVKTVIFSSRVCKNVELEVGNVICMYAPWKEVRIRDNDSIILCTYFSQRMP